MDTDTILSFLGEASRNQVVHSGFFFTLAALLHAKQVRKEIATQFSTISLALNNVADALKQDLVKHSERLDRVEKDVGTIKDSLKIIK